MDYIKESERGGYLLSYRETKLIKFDLNYKNTVFTLVSIINIPYFQNFIAKSIKDLHRQFPKEFPNGHNIKSQSFNLTPIETILYRYSDQYIEYLYIYIIYFDSKDFFMLTSYPKSILT